jgi:hypothetical protein
MLGSGGIVVVGRPPQHTLGPSPSSHATDQRSWGLSTTDPQDAGHVKSAFQTVQLVRPH